MKLLANRFVECVGSPDDDKYSYIWRSAIEEHEQDAYKDSFKTVLIDALRDTALGATSTASSEALDAAKVLFGTPYPTLVRVGIYVCGENYGHVGQVFWECLKQDWLQDTDYWHELYWFIKKAFTRFSARDRAQFLEMVDNFKGDWADEAYQEELDGCHRRDLLHPAAGLGDGEVDSRYNELVQRWGAVREHPDFHSYTTGTVSVGERSPVSSDVLVGMSDDELVALLRNFVPAQKEWDGPTYRGLASALSGAVRASEDGFSNRIKLFVDLGRPYQHGLLRGLKERWSDDKRDIDWLETLALVQSIVLSPSFKMDLTAERVEGWEPSIHWVISDIADLLKAGASSERQVAQDILRQSLEILQMVLAALKPSEASESKDALTHAINSPRGRTLEAFVHAALSMRRQEVAADQGEGATWQLVKPVFEVELASSETGRNADFAALLGMYCVNLHYINPQWVEDNFDRIFSTSSEEAWRCAAQGFAYQRYLYKWLFLKLSVAGHLKKMVLSEDLPDHVAQKALQFLGLAYLEELEDISRGGFLAELIAGLHEKGLSHLCWFFWTLRNDNPGTSPRAPRILAFWMKVAESMCESGREIPGIHSALSQLSAFIHDLTPSIVALWAAAAPHAEVKHHGYILIEQLARLVGQYPKEVTAVFLAALKGFTPEYPQEKVIQCVTQLADLGHVDEAESICNAYTENGSILLKDTYEALRVNQRTRLAHEDGSQ